ncbi:MAG TPA: hypothetical protein VFE15_06125 [Marmoricola sp.]|nr:hypothetical protein [Marmoricola sp.]
MNLWNVAVPALILVLIVSRQLQPRPVREDSPFRLLIILAVVGAVEVGQYAQGTTVPAGAWALLAISVVIGAGFGALRGALVHVWRKDGDLFRQGNAMTIVLWVVGLAIHFGIDAVIAHTSHAARDLGNDGVLLYVALALAAQRWVTLHRAWSLAPATQQIKPF